MMDPAVEAAVRVFEPEPSERAPDLFALARHRMDEHPRGPNQNRPTVGARGDGREFGSHFGNLQWDGEPWRAARRVRTQIRTIGGEGSLAPSRSRAKFPVCELAWFLLIECAAGCS